MPADDTSLLHQPAIALFMIMVSAAGLVAAVISLRNAGLWLLRLYGRRATGVVRDIEVVTQSNGEVLRRPVIAFTAADGAAVVATPALYRKKVRWDKGAAVNLSYASRRPRRIVVHGYDVRLREIIYAAAGLAVTFVVGSTYFRLW